MKLSKCIRCFACFPLMLFTGCASIMHGTRQSVGVSSYPSNAEVWVDNNYIGQSPTIVKLSRKDHHFVKVQLEGYQPYEITLTREVSGWVFGNLVFGGLVGLAVDAISGGLYHLTPGQVEAEMAKGTAFTSQNSEGLYIAAVMMPDPSWKKLDNLIRAN
jgi:hypothetical protein